MRGETSGSMVRTHSCRVDRGTVPVRVRGRIGGIGREGVERKREKERGGGGGGGE